MSDKRDPRTLKTLDSWLDEEGVREEVTAAALERVRVERVAKAMRNARIVSDEGEFPRLFDLLDFSGENNAHLVTNGLAQAALSASGADKLAEALERVVAWDMPATGKFWPNEDGTDSDRPMSYGAAYGSNGERDYIRNVARAALAEWRGE